MSNPPSLARLELERIKNLSAFSILGAKKHKVNQHMIAYLFKDNSVLEIYKPGKAILPYECITVIKSNCFGE